MAVCILHMRIIANFAMMLSSYNDIHFLFYRNVNFASTLISDYSTNAKIQTESSWSGVCLGKDRLELTAQF